MSLRSTLGSRWTLGLVVAATLVATCVPGDSGQTPLPRTCLICGERGVADLAANILLFLPLGLALGARGRGWGGAAAYGLLLSAGIETAQLFIPGRYPSASDLVFNTAGAALGALLFAQAGQWRQPSRIRETVYALATAAAALALIGGGAWLLAPSVPSGPYVVEWNPSPGPARPSYPGRVLSASSGGVSLRPGRVASTERVRAALDRRSLLEVRAASAPTSPGWSPILELSGRGDRLVAAIGADGRDLVYRLHTRASDLRLDRPELRLAGVLPLVTVDTVVSMRAWRTERGYCMAVARLQDCSLGFTVGDTWSVLLYPDGISERSRRLLGFAWLAILFVPAGFWARRPIDWILLVPAVLVGLAAIARLTWILPTGIAQLLPAMTGLAAGWLIRQALLDRNNVGALRSACPSRVDDRG